MIGKLAKKVITTKLKIDKTIMIRHLTLLWMEKEIRIEVQCEKDHFFGKFPDHDLIADRDEIEQSLFCLFLLE